MSGIKISKLPTQQEIAKSNNTSSPKSSASSENRQSEVCVQNEPISDELQNEETSNSTTESGAEESDEKWASAWKLQHKNIIITQFNSPHDFYVSQHTEK